MSSPQGITPPPAPTLSHEQQSMTPKGKRLEAKALREQGQRLMDKARLLEFAANEDELEVELRKIPGEDGDV